MKPQVIIFGTGHRLQAGHEDYSPFQLKALSDQLDRIRKKHRIKFIAEEMSNDALVIFGVTETVAKKFADSKKLTHYYIDLSGKERFELGVDRFSLNKIGKNAKLSEAQIAALEKAVDQLRECLWLVRVLDINKWPVLLICGANHAPRLEYLFNTVGKYALIEVNDYQAQPCSGT